VAAAVAEVKEAMAVLDPADLKTYKFSTYEN